MFAKISSHGLWIDHSLVDHVTGNRLKYGYPIVVELKKCEVEINIDDFDVDPGVSRNGANRDEGFITQRAALSRQKSDEGHGGPLTIVTTVRPVTSIAVSVLLAFIVIAFIIKLLTGGLSP